MGTTGTPPNGVLTSEQVETLLRPITPNRVRSDGKGHSHVAQQDVLAHLTRMFGFGNWDVDILNEQCLFETERVSDRGEPNGRWDCCYKATIRLTVRNPDGVEVCHFEGGSTDTAENQKRGEAHDLALKSALSLAMKRAAIHLGDQFGLSLYNKGQLEPLVRKTLVNTPAGNGNRSAGVDLQQGVPQQVSDGEDEAAQDTAAGVPVEVTELLAKAQHAAEAGDKESVKTLWRNAGVDTRSGPSGLGGTVADRLTELAQQAARVAEASIQDNDNNAGGDVSGKLADCGHCDLDTVFATGAHQEGCPANVSGT